MKHARFLILFVLAVCMTPFNVQAQVDLENAFPNLTFQRPVDFQIPGDGSNRVFVVEQAGVIQVFPNDPATSASGVFLNISEQVDHTGNEEGLLGLAFHPDYATNGYFYVDYTASEPERTVVSRFTVDPSDPDLADPESELVLLEVSQPYSNHNGGQVMFGSDGYLYVSFGDGGSGGDPEGNGQDRSTILGSIIRIDVDNPDNGMAYGIPEDNPFAGNNEGYREEIYAYGLRNPWRFSFDPPTGMMWCGDVGQNEWEEIDIIVSGGNYGWNIMEGDTCYESEDCDTEGLIMPVVTYGHDLGQSVTGGYVYRGDSAAELFGLYVYADFMTGRIWTLGYDDGSDPVNELLMDSEHRISSFGTDAMNELYICTFEGSIYRFVSPTDVGETSEEPTRFSLQENFPNPFNASTTISFDLAVEGDVSLRVINSSGQIVRTLVDGIMSAGRHQAVWDGNDDSGHETGSGIYHYRLTTPHGETSRRMTLLR